MENLINEIMPTLIAAAGVIITAIIGWVSTAIKAYFDEKGITRKIENNKYLAEIAVKAAKDAFAHQDSAGPDKFKYAKAKFEEMLPKNANVSSLEVDSFIRDAYIRMVEPWTAINDTDKDKIVTTPVEEGTIEGPKAL